MDIVRKGIGIGQTIRNVNRLKEIVLIFARHGFAEFISLGVIKAIPNFVLPKSKQSIKKELEEKEERDWWAVVGARLRIVFEELGPSFIKFGQLLSSREDIFDPSFIAELKPLRDRVKPIPFEVIRETVEETFGSTLEELFLEVNPNPLGTASIGVVYQAVLKDGTDVVIKVRRPKIERMIQTDFSILGYLANQAEKMSEDIKLLGVSKIVKEFSISIQTELNFHIEAMNCERLRENLSHHQDHELFYIPKVYKEYTRENILVIELLKGKPFSDQSMLNENLEDINDKLQRGVSLFLKSFLNDGFFHADLHGGNFFYMDDGKIGLIDFGLMGTLSRKNRRNLIAIIYSLLNNNHENLVYEFLDVADFDKTPDVDELIRDVRDCLNTFVGLTVQQTNLSLVLNSITNTLRQHQIYLPREWYIVFRALMTLDGVGKSVGLDYDILKLLDQDIEEIVSESFNKKELIEEGVWVAKDILSLARLLPRHLKWMVKEVSSKGYAFEIIHRGHESSFYLLSSSINFLAMSLISMTLIVSGVLVLGEGVISTDDIPILSWTFWCGGICFLLLGFFNLKKKKKN